MSVPEEVDVAIGSMLVLGAAALAVLLAVAWLISLALRDASVMDVFWGLGFVLIAWTSLLAAGSWSSRGWLVAVLVTLWGARLAGYLGLRKFGKPEDHRYRAWREHFGHRFWIVSLPFVFGLQGVLLWVVALPLPVAAGSTRSLNWLDALGVGVWALGLMFEALGDYQLARFKADPANRGQVCDRGLWRYSRHPNYFGDCLVWWGLYLIAVAGGAPWGLIVSPLLMSFLLIRVSGVALLEKSLAQRTGGYQEYVARTSAFFPWPPRR